MHKIRLQDRSYLEGDFMQKKKMNKLIILKIQEKLNSLGIKDKLDVFPVESTFSHRQRYWIDCKTGKGLFKVHMWNLNSLEDEDLEQEINSRIAAARAYFKL